MIRRDTLYFRAFCVTFWVFTTCRFILEEILPIPVSFKTFYLLCDVSILLLGLATLRDKIDKWLVAIFFIYALFVGFLNKVSIIHTLNGFRDYTGFIFGYIILKYLFTCSYAERFRKSLNKQLFIFLIIQAVCVTEQFLRYGAGDWGGGSFGNLNSGNVSTLIIAVSFYFVCKNWDSDSYFKSIKNNLLYIFLMFPVFLNETKVSFIFIFAYFIILLPFKAKNALKLVVALPLLILAMGGMYLIYDWAVDSRAGVLSEEGFFEEYLWGGEGSEDLLNNFEYILDNFYDIGSSFQDQLEVELPDVPRFLKVALLFPAMEETPGGLIFGTGVGHTRGGTNLARTDFYLEHMNIFIGTQLSLYYLFMPFGLVGLIWIIIWYKRVFSFRKRFGNMAVQKKLFVLFIIIFNLIYSSAMNFMAMNIILYYICLTTTIPLKSANKVNEFQIA